MTFSAATKTVTWDPTVAGEITFILRVTDSAANYSEQTFTVPAVLPAAQNAPPEITSIPTGPAVVGNDYQYQVLANDSDIGDTLTYSLVDPPGNLSIGSASGLLEFAPTETGSLEIAIVVEDGNGGTATQIFTLPIVDAPPPKGDAAPEFTTQPTGPAIIGQDTWTYPFNATDLEDVDSTLVYTLIAPSLPASNGTVTFNDSTKIISWDPAVAGEITFTLRVTDSANNYTDQTFTIPATGSSVPGNAPPQITSVPTGPAIVSVPYAYDLSATDPDPGDTLTFSLVNPPAGVSLNTTTDGVDLTPTEKGKITFVVKVDDGNGGVDLQTVELPVIDPDDPDANATPVITSRPTGPAVINDAWQYVVTATDLNDAAETLVYSLVEPLNETSVTFDPASQTLQWTPPVGAIKQDFRVRVTDPQGASREQSFTIDAVASLPTNAPPVVRSLPNSPVRSGEVYIYDVDAFDPDGDPLTYGLIEWPAGMTISDTGRVSWTTSVPGDYSITVEVRDGINAGVPHQYILTVLPPVQTNDPPEITSSPTGPAIVGRAYQYQLTGTDPNGDTIHWSLDTSKVPDEALGDPQDPGKLTFNGTNGLLTWTPTIEGTFDLIVTADDQQGAAVLQSFSLPVLKNAPPVITPPVPQVININTALSLTIVAADPNVGDTLSYSLDSDSVLRNMSIDTAGAITWAGQATTGLVPVIVTVADQEGAQASLSFDVQVIDPANNNPPTITSDPRDRIQFGQRLLHQVEANDADGDALTYTLVSGPTGMTMDAGGLIDWTPTAAQVSTTAYNFTIKVSDPSNASHEKAFPITVTNTAENRAPAFTTNPKTNLVAGNIYVYQANADDPDGDTVVYTLVNPPSGMQINPLSGRVQWQPTAANIGTATMTVRAADTFGLAVDQTVTLNVRGTNRPPKIDSDPINVAILNVPYSYPVLASDPDGDAITYSLGAATTATGNIAIDSVTGVLTWTPEQQHANNTYLVQVNAVDEFGLGVGQGFPIQVLAAPPNHPPTITSPIPDPQRIAASDLFTHDVNATDPDPGDGVTFTLETTGIPVGNEATIDAQTGIITWTPDPSLGNQIVDFKVIAKDNGGLTSWQSFGMLITGPNVPPTMDDILDQSVTAGDELQIDVQADDLRGDALTYSLDEPSIDRGMTIDAVGRIRWKTDQDDITAPPHHTVTVMVSDGRYTIEDDFLLSVVDDTTPPDITLAASASGVHIGEFLDLTVHAIDDVGVVETTLTLYSIEDLAGNFTYPDEKLALTPQGKHRLTALTEHLGFLTFHATAKDAKNPEVSAAPLVVQVFDPNDTTAPTVNLLPPDGVVTVPTDLLGTIEDDQSVTWTLTATPVDTELMGDWTRKIGEGGSGNVVPAGVVGRFDPTNLPNGSYVVTLEAKDGGGQTASDSEIVTVDGRLKLGNFSLSFNDLEIPVAGIPITVTRTYDTLDSQGSGDFGYGWNLQVVQPEMTLDYSTVYPGGAFINGTRITVTTPEGTEEGFTFKWIQVGDGLGGIGQSASWGPSFVPDPGNNYELVPPNLGYTFTRLTENGPYQVAGGTVLYSGQNPSFGGAYELKEIGPGTRGLIYTISAATMTGTRVTDKYGNGLRFSDTEIKSVRVDSEGKETPLGRDIAIERDFRGNIKTITDPNGFELRYEYDSRGRLVSFYDRARVTNLTKA